MPTADEIRYLARLTTIGVLVLLTPLAVGLAISRAVTHRIAVARPAPLPDVALPLDMQGSISHSLPIAGLLVTPDDVAQQVVPNPRMRVTTGTPVSGRGSADPIPESDVGDTLAGPLK